MTDIRTELLRAALASTDDAERLVYADWLEEHGEIARAQIIQLQCEIARLDPHDRRRIELQWEADAVLWELGDRWRDELPALDGVEWLELERGFASAVRVHGLDTLYRFAHEIAGAAQVYRVDVKSDSRRETSPAPTRHGVTAPAAPVALPWLRVVRVDCIAQYYARDAISLGTELELTGDDDVLGWFERAADAPLTRFSVIGNIFAGPGFVARVVAAPWAVGLTAFDFPSHWIDYNKSYGNDPRLGVDGALALTRLTQLASLTLDRQRIGSALGRLVGELPALRELSVRECECTDLGGLERSGGAPLRRLDLSGNAFGYAGVQTIARAPRLRALHRLDLDTCEIESMGLAELTYAPLWHELRWLELSRNPLGAAGVRALADAPPPALLHTLVLADTDLDDAAGRALSQVTWLGELSTLDLSENRLGRCAESLHALASGALRKLVLASCGLDTAEVVAIARIWPQLVHLDLSGNSLFDDSLEHFLAADAQALQSLRLRDCKLGNHGLELLALVQTPRLRTLDLGRNMVRKHAFAAFLRSPVARSLESLEVSYCSLGNAVEALASSPLPRLRYLNLRGNTFDDEQVLMLARSEALGGVLRIEFSSAYAQCSRSTRDLLGDRGQWNDEND